MRLDCYGKDKLEYSSRDYHHIFMNGRDIWGSPYLLENMEPEWLGHYTLSNDNLWFIEGAGKYFYTISIA